MGTKIRLTETEIINLIEKMIKEYDKPAMTSFQKQYGKKKGKSVYYATAKKQHRSPETFKLKESEENINESDLTYKRVTVLMRKTFDKIELEYLENLINSLKEKLKEYPNLTVDVVNEVNDRIKYYERKKQRLIDDINYDMEERKQRRLRKV